jgi:hypothetical protein
MYRSQSEELTCAKGSDEVEDEPLACKGRERSAHDLFSGCGTPVFREGFR